MSFMPGVCNLCGTGCGHFLRTEGGKVSSVAPLQAHPVSHGRLCIRGWHVNELLCTEERIDTPLIREKGALRPATAEEAIGVVVRRLGALARPAEEAAVLASARSSNEEAYLLMRLARSVLGTNNISVGAEAGHPETLRAIESAFGIAGAIGDLTRIDRAKYILVVGSDLTKLNPVLGANVHRAARSGASVVVFCVTRTQIAELASRHYRPKPGALRFLLDALSKAILEERMSDPAFAERALPRFGEFALRLRDLTPERLAESSGVPFDRVREEARRLLAAESAVFLFSSGVSGLDRETIRALVNASILSGKMGGADSALIPAAGICNLQGSFDMGLSPERTVGWRPLGDDETRRALASAWGEAPPARPGRAVYDLLADRGSPLRALFVVDHDDGIVRYRDRIASLDFVVYAGAFRNPFQELAHVVLPVAAFAETDGTYTASDRRVQFSPAKTDPAPGVDAAWKLYAEIARAAGRKWSYESASDVFDEIAAVVPGYAGMNHEALGRSFGRHWEPERDGRPISFLPAEDGVP
ncbi:MAG: hypothetical protein EHM19_06910, partial [Candidatus Latescibacterota bacterium]